MDNTTPASIATLLEPVLAGKADIAIGSRFLGRMEYSAGWIRRLGMEVFGAIVERCTGRHVTDPTSGFQAMNADVLSFFARDNYPSDYPDADTLLLLNYAGFRAIEVPVCMRGRMAGVSMHSSWKSVYYVFKMFLSIMMVLLRQRTNGNARRRACVPAGMIMTPDKQ